MELIAKLLPVMLALLGLVLVMAGLLGQSASAGRRVVPGLMLLTVAPLFGSLGPANMLALVGLVGLTIGLMRAVSTQNQLLDVAMPIIAGLCLMMVGQGEEFLWALF
jgi:hypothetical protein